MGCMVLGLESLVRFVLEDPSQSSYVCSCFTRLDMNVRRLIAIRGIASYLPDSILDLLVEGERLRGELSFFSNLLAEVWLAISTAPGYEGNLKNDAYPPHVWPRGLLLRACGRLDSYRGACAS